MNSPVELPTTRQSRNFHQAVNIHDPNWIPVLNKTSPRLQGSPQYFDAQSQFPTRGSSRPATPKEAGIHSSRTRQSQALELDSRPVLGSRQGSTDPHNRHISRETEDTIVSSSDDTTHSGPSTAGTNSVLEDQVYTLPATRMLKEARSFSQASILSTSDRGSVTSTTRKAAIPTSRYNRKPGANGSLPTTPTTVSPPSFPQTQNESPRTITAESSQTLPANLPSRIQNIAAQHKQTPDAHFASLRLMPHSPDDIGASVRQQNQSPDIPELASGPPNSPPARYDTKFELADTTALPQIPPDPPSYESSQSKNRKSTSSIRTTVSVRKKRALHSHPSNPSMRSEKLESIADSSNAQGTNTQSSDSPSTVTPTSASAGLTRRRTNESRRSVTYDAEPPTEAPSEPLPELPQKLATKRPSTRQRMHKTSEGNLSLFPQQTQAYHHGHSGSLPRNQSQSQSQTTPPTLHPSPSIISNTTVAAAGSPAVEKHRHNKSEAASTNVPHKELANFMTSKSTLIFRRFDDMHVKLLLSIQDEMTALERELLDLEAASTSTTSGGESVDEDEDNEDIPGHRYGNDGEKSSMKRRPSRNPKSRRNGESKEVRRDKRKAKIMAEMRRLLAEYDHLFSNWTLMQKSAAPVDTRRELERFLVDDIGTSETARSDLLWAERNANDLSYVVVGEKPASADEIDSSEKEKNKILTWGKSKGKAINSGLGLTSRPATSSNAYNNGGLSGGLGGFRSMTIGNNADGEKKFATGTDSKNKSAASVLGSWFGSCAGKRK